MKTLSKSDPLSIEKMFDQIASTYDWANRILSLGIDRYWRYQMCRLISKKEQIQLLDCATGTGDQLLAFLKNGKVHECIGIDVSEKMLSTAQKKLQCYSHQVSLKKASAVEIPYLDSTFDCVSISFGIRNISPILKCFEESYRVLKPLGEILILEFSLPSSRLMKKMYLVYLNKILPKIGKLLSSHPDAYNYLSKTIQTFPYGDRFCSLLRQAGFQSVKAYPLTFGIVTIYQGKKDAKPSKCF